MKIKKPMLFLGSSSEAKRNGIPQAFAASLTEDARVIPWWDAPQFSAMETTIDAIYQAANEYDFSVFVLTPDDELKTREKEFCCPRDNVLFELALFLGAIGPERTMAVMQADANIKLPSDLSGVTVPRFDVGDEYDMISSMNDACKSLKSKIKQQGRKKLDLLLARNWKFNSKTRCFEVSIASERLVRQQKILGSRKLCVAARIENDQVEFLDDANVAFSQSRGIPNEVKGDLVLSVESDAFNEYDATLKASKIEARLILVPNDIGPIEDVTVRQALAGGCNEMESMSITSGNTVCPECGAQAAL